MRETQTSKKWGRRGFFAGADIGLSCLHSVFISPLCSKAALRFDSTSHDSHVNYATL